MAEQGPRAGRRRGPRRWLHGPWASVDDRRRRTVLRTTSFCAVVASAGHALLWLAYSAGWNDQEPYPVPWQAVSGIVLVLVAITSFGGFYTASNRMRVAIAASFLLTFLVMLSFSLTIRAFAAGTVGDASELVRAFRDVVKTVAAFYFGSEAVVSGAKALATGRAAGADKTAVGRSDRDLPEG